MRVRVWFRMAGTVHTTDIEAPQILVQLWDSGMAKLTLKDAAGSELSEEYFRRVDRITRETS